MRKNVLPKVSVTLSCIALGLAIFNGAAKDTRIQQLEQDRDIYKSRFQNWSERAMQDEETIERLQEEVLPEGMTAEYAGEFPARRIARRNIRISAELEPELQPAAFR